MNTKYFWHPLALLLAIPLGLQACMSNSESNSHKMTNNTPAKNTSSTTSQPKENKDDMFVKKLADLLMKDPVVDANIAIAKGDTRLIAKAGRGLNVPGFSAAEAAVLKPKCGLRYEDGFGDMLYGENHQRYYKALIEYARQYNVTIKPACQ